MENKNRLDDIKRLEEIARLHLYEDIEDSALNKYVIELREKLEIQTCIISVILDEAQYYLSSDGVTGWAKDVNGVPTEWSFCENVIKSGKKLIVEDATKDDFFKHNVMVLNEGVRCYLGIPLHTKNGYTIGTICVAGDEARTFNDDEVKLLKSYATKVINRFEEMALES